LLAEHLGISAGEIRKSMESTGSLIGAIESLRGRERTLEPLDEQLDPPAIRITPDIDWIDPEKPYRPEIIVENLMNGHESKSSGTYHWAGLAITAFLAIALALAWRWGPLAHVFDIESLIALGSFLRRNYLAPVFVVAAYMIGGLVVFPITILIVATALLFGPLTSLFYALLGVLASASFTYFLGHQLGRKTIRRMLGERINTLSKRVAKQGILTMAIARNLPIAPFTIVNIVAGASHVQFKDYLIGTIIGMAPGTVALTMLSDRFKAVFLHPGLTNIVILFAVALIVMLGAIVVQRFIRKKT
jgi:phospholipase D1/2